MGKSSIFSERWYFYDKNYYLRSSNSSSAFPLQNVGFRSQKMEGEKALEEARAIDELIVPPTAEVMEKYESYKESFSIIAKGGKYMAFRYAFMVGYNAGKEESEHE